MTAAMLFRTKRISTAPDATAPDGSEVLVLHFPHGYGGLETLPEDRQALIDGLEKMRARIEPYTTTQYALAPNGTDHMAAHDGLPAFIKAANEVLKDGGAAGRAPAEMVHGDYPMYLDLVKQELGDRYQELPLMQGEFRNSRRLSSTRTTKRLVVS